MSKTRLWGAFALAVIIGGHGARGANADTLLSPKDFVMAASQSDQYEILAAGRGLSTRPGSARSNVRSGDDPGPHSPRRRLAQSGRGFRIAAA